MKRRMLGLSLLALLALGLALPAMAQDSRVYVRVELWDVKRESWPAFVKDYEKYDLPVYQKLLADGVINEYGIDSATLHNPQGYTHSTWHAATSMAAFEKVQEAFDAAEKVRGEAEQAKLTAAFSGMIVKHRDYMLLIEAQKAKAGKLDKAYFYETSVAVKPGQGEAYVSYWNQHTKPIYEKLMADGVVLAYGRGREEITTDGEDRRGSWYVVADLAGHDKVQAAFRESWDKMTEEQRRARWASIREVTEMNSFRENMTRLIHWQITAQ
ncbi:MAG TPA: hypothetical protein VNN18_11135 [Candidatus Xenobia bacterium]|nr:hypothetical protein [Candidatus Xenobia bacterium]